MAKYLLVDAYSIIHAWPRLYALHQRRLSLAREALIRELTYYHDTSDTRVVIVFDGQGQQRVTETTEPGGVQIFYSGRGVSADAIIERLVARYGATHDITVATGDLMERQTVSTFGASCLSPEELYALVGRNL